MNYMHRWFLLDRGAAYSNLWTPTSTTINAHQQYCSAINYDVKTTMSIMLCYEQQRFNEISVAFWQTADQGLYAGLSCNPLSKWCTMKGKIDHADNFNPRSSDIQCSYQFINHIDKWSDMSIWCSRYSVNQLMFTATIFNKQNLFIGANNMHRTTCKLFRNTNL